MTRFTVEGHNTRSMTIKQAFLSVIILLGTVHICSAQEWAYSSSGTETRGSYRYASLKAGATESLRASSIYINYYDVDQKYNIYLYEVTELECSENTIQYFTDVDREPRSFGVASRSDGIETIAMTEIEDLSTFLTSVKSASVLTIRINNTCDSGRDINFPMDNAVETVEFMTASAKIQDQVSSSSVKSGKEAQQQVSSSSVKPAMEAQDQVSSSSVKTATEVQDQVSSSSVKTAMEVQVSRSSVKTVAEVQEQVSSASVKSGMKDSVKKEAQQQISSSSVKSDIKENSTSANTQTSGVSKETLQELYKSVDAEWERLARRSEELDRKDSLLVVFQSQLDARELDLIQQEQALAAQPAPAPVQSQPATYSPPAQTYTAPDVQTTNYPYRYVQFIATSEINNYDRLSYIGQIVTEQIPGRNTIRYKVMGQWSNADVARVKNQLSQEGFQGAFESK